MDYDVWHGCGWMHRLAITAEKVSLKPRGLKQGAFYLKFLCVCGRESRSSLLDG